MTDLVRTGALVLGIGYLAAGVIGFAVTGFDGIVDNGDDKLLIFEINPFHNIVHIGTGALWLLGAMFPRREAAEGIHQGIAIVYALATVLGAMGALTMLSIDGFDAPDNLLHAASALAAATFAIIARGQSRAVPATG